MGDISPVVGILLFAVLVAAIWGFQKLMGAGARTATRAIARGAHRDGQDLVRTPQRFTVPHPPAKALEDILAAVNPYPSAPAVVGGLYLQARTSNEALIAFGSKLGDAFVAQLTLTAPGGDVTQGTLTVLKWTESDGLVAGRDHVRRLHDRVRSAVTDLGGTVHAVPGSQTTGQGSR